MLNFCTRCDNLPWGRHSKGSTHTGINLFSKLRRLNINVFRMSMKDLLLLTPILQSCPLLQEFCIDTKEQPEDDDDSRAQGGKKEKAVVLHSELKEVKMSGFVGSENEIEFALYIFKSAICLEKMEISRFEKEYTVYSKWRRYRQTPWSDETKSTMCRRLQGQAVFKTARVIINY
ncbi:hypothetical protein ACP275_03G109400 [Erythranthe tilingii]